MKVEDVLYVLRRVLQLMHDLKWFLLQCFISSDQSYSFILSVRNVMHILVDWWIEQLGIICKSNDLVHCNCVYVYIENQL